MFMYVATVHGSMAIACILASTYHKILNDGDMSAAAKRPMTGSTISRKKCGEWNKILVESQSQKDQLREIE